MIWFGERQDGGAGDVREIDLAIGVARLRNSLNRNMKDWGSMEALVS